MQAYQYTHASIEHPDRDEDGLLALQPEGKAPVFVVIDGMGGHQHVTASGQRLTGRDAAQMLVESLTTGLASLPPEVDASPDGAAEQSVIQALENANLRVNTDLN